MKPQPGMSTSQNVSEFGDSGRLYDPTHPGSIAMARCDWCRQLSRLTLMTTMSGEYGNHYLACHECTTRWEDEAREAAEQAEDETQLRMLWGDR